MRIPARSAAAALGAVVVAALLSSPSAGGTTSGSACQAPARGVLADAVAATFYDGPSASATYDRLFQRSVPIPHLPDYVPQGLTTWPDWNGAGDTLLVVGLYRGTVAEAEQSLLAAVDPESGEHFGTVRVLNSHLGGIAVAGDYLFAQDRATKRRETVRRYRLSSLRAAFSEANRTGDMPFVGRMQDVQEVHAADFMTVHKGQVWSGRYNEFENDRMYSYDVEADGRLTTTGPAWPIPPRTQGVLTTDRAFVFNTFNHSQPSVVVVAERSRSATRNETCFGGPSMAEGLAAVGDRAFTVFEGASYRYPNAVNRVPDAHVASIRSLEALL